MLISKEPSRANMMPASLRRICNKKRLYKLVLICLICFTVDYFGVFKHIFEVDYARYFSFPLEDNNAVRTNAAKLSAGQIPDIPAINEYNFSFLKSPNKCAQQDKARLTIMIKSALKNRAYRDAIRRSWGYEQRFSDIVIHRLFMLGATDDVDISKEISAESDEYADIVQSNFVDTYFNNTIKTMMGIRWAVEHCAKSDHYLFVDDDYYVSIKNMLRFIYEASENDNKLFAGYVIQSAPHRHRLSKWYVSLKEYPYDLWPPYVTAGAFVLSREALHEIYYTSKYTKHFRFDDIYLGIVALKANIVLTHSKQFHFYRPTYKGPESYRNVLASHGFDDVQEMEQIWNECRSSGTA